VLVRRALDKRMSGELLPSNFDSDARPAIRELHASGRDKVRRRRLRKMYLRTPLDEKIDDN
jgi:hypothetical protein